IVYGALARQAWERAAGEHRHCLQQAWVAEHCHDVKDVRAVGGVQPCCAADLLRPPDAGVGFLAEVGHHVERASRPQPRHALLTVLFRIGLALALPCACQATSSEPGGSVKLVIMTKGPGTSFPRYARHLVSAFLSPRPSLNGTSKALCNSAVVTKSQPSCARLGEPDQGAQTNAKTSRAV